MKTLLNEINQFLVSGQIKFCQSTLKIILIQFPVLREDLLVVDPCDLANKPQEHCDSEGSAKKGTLEA